jgi:hypothetical protein
MHASIGKERYPPIIGKLLSRNRRLIVAILKEVD